MSTPDNLIHIRDADKSDAEFVVEAFDSTLPYLASVGAGEMWGEEPFSRREGFLDDIVDTIEKVEGNESDDSRRVLIAEILSASNDNIQKPTRIAAAMIRDSLPRFLHERVELANEIAKGLPLLYLEVLVADHRLGSERQGAGPALTNFLKQRAQSSGKRVLYVDAWAGNDRKLNRYYTDLGFVEVGDFSLARKNGSTWTGTLLRMDLC